ncbi:MAG: TRAP transporter small permease [Gammaproteobacteria bacterium]|nr:TRAP transporter small permease [Gammaproteobacteria bacterium]
MIDLNHNGLDAPKPPPPASPLIAKLHYLEDVMLVVLIGAMALFAIAQILLRNLFGGGLVWADPLLRALVLWVAMIGAMVATRDNRHIRIDVLSRYLPKRWTHWLHLLIHGVSFFICLLLAWHSMRFVGMELEAGTTAFAFVTTWIVAAVIPLGFSVMALRFALYALHELSGITGISK